MTPATTITDVWQVLNKLWRAGWDRTSNAATVTAGAGAGTTPTVALSSGSNSFCGQVQCLSGTTMAAGVVGTVNLALGAQAGTDPLVVLLTPANTGAHNLKAYVGTVTASSFQLKIDTAGADATQYNWNYFIIG